MSEQQIRDDEHVTRTDGSTVSADHIEDVRRQARRESASMMADPDGPRLVGLRDDSST